VRKKVILVSTGLCLGLGVFGLAASSQAEGVNAKAEEKLQAIEQASLKAGTVSKETNLLQQMGQELQNGDLSVETMKKVYEQYGDLADIVGFSKEDLLSFLASDTNKRVDLINTEIDKVQEDLKQAEVKLETLKRNYNSYDQMLRDTSSDLEEKFKAGQIDQESYSRGLMRLGSLSSSNTKLTEISNTMNAIVKREDYIKYLTILNDELKK